MVIRNTPRSHDHSPIIPYSYVDTSTRHVPPIGRDVNVRALIVVCQELSGGTDARRFLPSYSLIEVMRLAGLPRFRRGDVVRGADHHYGSYACPIDLGVIIHVDLRLSKLTCVRLGTEERSASRDIDDSRLNMKTLATLQRPVGRDQKRNKKMGERAFAGRRNPATMSKLDITYAARLAYFDVVCSMLDAMCVERLQLVKHMAYVLAITVHAKLSVISDFLVTARRYHVRDETISVVLEGLISSYQPDSTNASRFLGTTKIVSSFPWLEQTLNIFVRRGYGNAITLVSSMPPSHPRNGQDPMMLVILAAGINGLNLNMRYVDTWTGQVIRTITHKYGTMIFEQLKSLERVLDAFSNHPSVSIVLPKITSTILRCLDGNRHTFYTVECVELCVRVGRAIAGAGIISPGSAEVVDEWIRVAGPVVRSIGAARRFAEVGGDGRNVLDALVRAKFA